MSMISSLDALEVTTDATSVPRAAVFQPKVKARVRKGGVGAQTSSVSTKPPPVPVPRERAGTASANVTPVSVHTKSVEIAAEIVTKVSELENRRVVDIKAGTGEEFEASPDRVIRETDDTAVPSTQPDKPGVAVEGSQDLSETSGTLSADQAPKFKDERGPVAIRTKFPVPPSGTGVTSAAEDAELDGRSSPERDDANRVTSERSRSPDVKELNPAQVQKPNSGPSPQLSNSGLAGLKKLARKDSRRPEASIEEEEEREEKREEGEEGEEIEEGKEGQREEETGTEVAETTAVIPEVVSAGLRPRKRKFAHSTSRPRMNRADKDGVALKIDFSKTDLSNPGKLTMREIIRRAEAIERKKLKAEGNKKSAQNDGKEKRPSMAEAPGRDAISLVPQVQVINGRIVVNEQSLTVGAYATSRLNTETYTRVEENASRLNYNSYRDKTPTERWKVEDTDVFYLALKQFGTDFELIQNLFPGRTRRQVKAKFKKEEKSNPRRLQDALAHRPNDQVHYTDMINRLKTEEPDPTADDPFGNILAYTANPVADQPAAVT